MKKNKGFTLIELMIVVAIISILMGATFKLINTLPLTQRRVLSRPNAWSVSSSPFRVTMLRMAPTRLFSLIKIRTCS